MLYMTVKLHYITHCPFHNTNIKSLQAYPSTLSIAPNRRNITEAVRPT